MTPPSGCVPSSPPWRLSVSRWQRPTLAGSAEPRPLAPRGVGSGRSWRGWLTEQGLFDQVSPKREDHTTVTVRQLSAAPQPCLGATAAKVLLGSAMLGAALVTEGFQPSIGCAGVPGTGQRALLGRHRTRAGHGSRHRRLELTLHWIRRIGRYVEMQRAGGHHRVTGAPVGTTERVGITELTVVNWLRSTQPQLTGRRGTPRSPAGAYGLGSSSMHGAPAATDPTDRMEQR